MKAIHSSHSQSPIAHVGATLNAAGVRALRLAALSLALLTSLGNPAWAQVGVYGRMDAGKPVGAALPGTPATNSPVQQGVATPGNATIKPLPAAGTSLDTGANAPSKTVRAGGDVRGLQVDQGKVQDARPGKTGRIIYVRGAAQPRPSAGTSPNTGGSAAPAPALLPGKP
jgi:hypothetical protein